MWTLSAVSEASDNFRAENAGAERRKPKQTPTACRGGQALSTKHLKPPPPQRPRLDVYTDERVWSQQQASNNAARSLLLPRCRRLRERQRQAARTAPRRTKCPTLNRATNRTSLALSPWCENAIPARRTSAEASTTRRSDPDSLYQRHGLCDSRVRRERATQPALLDRTDRTDLRTGALESVTDAGNSSYPPQGPSARLERITRYVGKETWKHAIIARFHRRMSMQDFLDLQSKRRLRPSETIVEYMYSKNALLDKAPYPLATEERDSLILSGIGDNTWVNPLAAKPGSSVVDLIDHAALLDTRRRPSPPPTDHNKVNRLNHKPQRNTDWDDAAGSRGNGRGDDTLQPQRPSRGYKPPYCYNCDEPRHLSRQCSRPKTAATIRAEERRAGRANDRGGRSATGMQANCFLKSTGGSLLIVTGFVNNRPSGVCIESVANVSSLSESAVSPDIRSHP
ncbi:hypothetical protein HPB48_009986 [Haemaphysalis longicornis]|uniref:CCHC-type domain-containing protein n=1 Tax=Haemaphysalis longicornis TaxID=44386 RepID=A0A9J6FXS6_HAELO|nr:hypothetical protein HPB48_009986 [Haemaphysalis longicornis]